MLGGVHAYLGSSGLPVELINLAYLRASQINGCAFCIDMHTHDLIEQGLHPEKLMLTQVWREAGSLFDEREKAALAWSETVTQAGQTRVPDADFETAKEVFSDKELADLTLAVALINAYNRLSIAFRRPPASVEATKTPSE
jgi:AhpD family alkylhydroperoxidase